MRALTYVFIFTASICSACKAKETKIAKVQPANAVVLCFHDVGRSGRYAITNGDFTEIMDLLRDFSVTSLGQWIESEDRIGARANVVLTFDDGYPAQREIVLPELKRRGYGATFYFYADQLKADKKWQTLIQTAGDGFEYGSHSWSHQLMQDLAGDEIFRELYLARNFMEALTRKRLVSFAWPYGYYNDAGVTAAHHAGFSNQVSVDYRIAKAQDIPQIIPRFTVMGKQPVKQVREILKRFESDQSHRH